MISDSCGNQSQENLYPYQGNQEENTIKHGSPHQYEGNYLGAERNRFVFTVVADIRTKITMIEQPVIEGYSVNVPLSKKSREKLT